MRVYYDLHIHSCLSPCGADDMTPNNLVNMAYLAGLQVIAVSDHNTTRNVPSAIRAGQRMGVLVVPGYGADNQGGYSCAVPAAQ